jgi:hypothetical protein
MELLPDQQQAYQEERQALVHARQIDVELWATHHQDEVTSERAALDAKLTELHQRKSTLGTEQATTIDLTKARARARAITAAINHEGIPHLTFARASQNVVATAATSTWMDTFVVFSNVETPSTGHSFRATLSTSSRTVSPGDGREGDIGWDTDW